MWKRVGFVVVKEIFLQEDYCVYMLTVGFNLDKTFKKGWKMN